MAINLTDVAVQIHRSEPTVLGSVAATATDAHRYALNPDGDFVYATTYVNSSTDAAIEVFNISTPASPSSVYTGTIGSRNYALHGIAFDSTGDYMYIPESGTGLAGEGDLLTFDITTRASPSLTHTLTTSAANSNIATVIKVGSYLYLQQANKVHRIDISTPSTPSISATLTLSVSIFAQMVYATPDSKWLYYVDPYFADIYPVDIDGTMTEGTRIDLPVVGSGGPQVYPLGIVFSSTTDMLVLGGYEADATNFPEELTCFWLLYEAGAGPDWSAPTITLNDKTSGTILNEPIGLYSAEGFLLPKFRITGPPTVASVIRGSPSETYIYTFNGLYSPADTSFYSGGDTSKKGWLVVWTVAGNPNPPTPVSTATNRVPRALTVIEVENLHSLGPLELTGTTLVGMGFDIGVTAAGVDDTISGAQTLVTIEVPDGWVELPAVLSNPGIEYRYGLPGTRATDRVASPGTMTFQLDNSQFASDAGVAIGRFSPDHASLFEGFRIGREIRLAVTYDPGAGSATFYPWWGVIDSIQPAPGQYRSRRTSVVCVDLMDFFSKVQSLGLTYQTGITSQQAVALLLNYLPTKQVAATVDVHSEAVAGEFDTYLFMFDTSKDERTGIIGELQKLCLSDRSFAYVVGGVFCYEPRNTRASIIDANTPDITLGDSDILELVPQHAAEDVLNFVRAQVFPRSVDSGLVTLFNLDSTPQILAGTPYKLTAAYRDPNLKARRVAGFDMVAPVSTTDYTFNTAEGGGGTDITHQISIRSTFGGNSAELEVVNNGPADGFLTLLKLRGKGVYTYEPITVARKNVVSQAQFGPSELTYPLPYQTTTPIAEDAAQYLVSKYGTPRTFVRSVSVFGNDSTARMNFVIRDGSISSHVRISETLTGLASVDYFVNEVHVRIIDDGLVYASYGLAVADTDSIFIVGDGSVGSLLDGTETLGSSFVA